MGFLKRIFGSGLMKILGPGLGGAVFMVAGYFAWGRFGARYLMLLIGGVVLAAILIISFFLLVKYFQAVRGKKMDAALAQQMRADHQKRAQTKAAINDVKGSWKQAMATLKSSNVKMYDLPWVMLIGEPQSGKTTSLRQSGLDFPLGKDALSGSGGTVNCDWWFSSESVVIDTAGRFTMPVDSAPDRVEWHTFLDMLVKYRPGCPINGIVVTIPVTSLMDDDQQAIEAKASKIREKLQELLSRLGVEFPVYIMVSKLDLVSGFAEFCSPLAAGEQQQIFGIDPKVGSGGFDGNGFTTLFNGLTDNIRRWSLRRVRDIGSGSEASRVFGFSSEFKKLQTPLHSYLDIIFKQDRYHANFLWRGCYFSSGLQEGRALAELIPEAQSLVHSRSYFILNFYRKIFGERGLVSRSTSVVKREALIRKISFGGGALILAVTGWLLWSGCTSLVKSLEPIEGLAKQAAGILGGQIDSEGAITHRASEVMPVLEGLEEGRRSLVHNKISRRFLHSGNNSLVTDLGRIEDALILRGLIAPAMNKASANYATPLSNLSHEQALAKTILATMGVSKGVALADMDINAVIEVLYWQEPAWLNIDKKSFSTMWANYPAAGETYPALEQWGLGSIKSDVVNFKNRKGLGKIHTFWEEYPHNAWQDVRKKLRHVSQSYSQVLALGMGKGSHDQSDPFADFIKNVDALGADGTVQVWSNKIYAQCESDYKTMQMLTASEAGVHPLASTIKRHQRVCASQNDKVGTAWQKDLKRYGKFLNSKGELSADLVDIRRAAGLAVTFAPLFQNQHQSEINRGLVDPPATLKRWKWEWQEARKIKYDEIMAILGTGTMEAWQKDELLKALDAYLQELETRANNKAAVAVLLADFNRDWARFSGLWKSELGSVFPFGSKKVWVIDENRKGKTRLLALNTSSLEDLHSFFFSDKGLEKFIEDYPFILDRKSPKRRYLSKTQLRFFSNAMAWRNFLFTKDNRAKSHDMVVSMLENKNSGRNSASSYFTQLRVRGMDTKKGNTLRLRFSGRKYKKGRVMWNPLNENSISFVAVNEETGQESRLELGGGNDVLPLFLTRMAKARRKAAGTRYEFQVRFVVPGNKDRMVAVPMACQFDTAMPSPIVWFK